MVYVNNILLKESPSFKVGLFNIQKYNLFTAYYKSY